MIEYDYNVIEDKLVKLPDELQAALTSVEIAERLKDIGARYDLKLDQEAALYDLIAYTILGLVKSTDFVKTLSHEAMVDADTAKDIAKDVNSEIFGEIRSAMRLGEENAYENKNPERDFESRISAVERAGGFEIERPETEHEFGAAVAPEPQPAAQVEAPAEKVSEKTIEEAIPDHMLPQPAAKSPENNAQSPRTAVQPQKITTPTPKPAPKTSVEKSPVEESEIRKVATNKKVPLAEELLKMPKSTPQTNLGAQGPTSQPARTIGQRPLQTAPSQGSGLKDLLAEDNNKPTTQQSAPSRPPERTNRQKSGSDPYREPIT